MVKLLEDIRQQGGLIGCYTKDGSIAEVDDLKEKALEWIKHIAKEEDIDLSLLDIKKKNNNDFEFTYNGETKTSKEEQIYQAMALAQIAWIVSFFGTKEL